MQNNSKRFSNAFRMLLVEYLLGKIVTLCPKDDKLGILLLRHIKEYIDTAVDYRKNKKGI